MYVIIPENEDNQKIVLDCRDVLKATAMIEGDIGAFVQTISREAIVAKDNETTNKAIIEQLEMGGTKLIKKHFKNLINLIIETNPSYALSLERFLHNFTQSSNYIKIVVVPKEKTKIFIGSPLWKESAQIVQISWHGENNIVDIKDASILPLKSAYERLGSDFILAATHDELNADIDKDLIQ